ncbi:hypothetical protein TIFTF001_032932 [Ficus carica]|uniref:Uncharacterized protein n=1 Tax=Ficus carica TaxID=3494 RepID=A0AA88DXK9_FICCA|nr:hypothetical protein TIFTF001_032932 [Ficus carica]
MDKFVRLPCQRSQGQSSSVIGHSRVVQISMKHILTQFVVNDVCHDSDSTDNVEEREESQ